MDDYFKLLYAPLTADQKTRLDAVGAGLKNQGIEIDHLIFRQLKERLGTSAAHYVRWEARGRRAVEEQIDQFIADAFPPDWVKANTKTMEERLRDYRQRERQRAQEQLAKLAPRRDAIDRRSN